MREGDLIRIDRDRIGNLTLIDNYYDRYQKMLNNVISSKIDVDRICFDFYGDDGKFSTVWEALFNMYGMFLGKKDIYFDLLDYGIKAINSIISVSQKRPILATSSFFDCSELDSIYRKREAMIMRGNRQEINLYINEMKIVPAVLRYLCKVSVGTNFSLR